MARGFELEHRNALERDMDTARTLSKRVPHSVVPFEVNDELSSCLCLRSGYSMLNEMEADFLETADEGARPPSICSTVPQYGLSSGTNKQLLFEACDVIDGGMMSIVELGKTNQSNGQNVYRFSTNGRTIAAGYADGYIRVFDTVTENAVGKIKASDTGILSLSFQRDSEDVLSCVDCEGLLTVWQKKEEGWHRIKTDQYCISKRGRKCYNWFEVSRNGENLVHTCWWIDGTSNGRLAEEWSSKTNWYATNSAPFVPFSMGEDRRRPSSERHHFRLSDNGRGILMSVHNATFYNLNCVPDSPICRLNGGYGQWVSDGRIVTFDENKRVSYLWNVDTQSNEEVILVKGAVYGIFGERMLARLWENPFQIQVIDVRTGSVLHQIDVRKDSRWHEGNHSDYPIACISDNGEWIATCFGGNLTVLGGRGYSEVLRTCAPDGTLDEGGANELCFAPGGDQVVLASTTLDKVQLCVCKVACFEGSLHVYDLPDCNFINWQIANDGNRIGAISMAQGTDKNFLRVWSLQENRILTMRRYGFLECFCFSHVGQKVAAASRDGRIWIWNTEHKSESSEKANTSLGHCLTIRKSDKSKRVKGVSFVQDMEGSDVLVLLYGDAQFVWVDVSQKSVANAKYAQLVLDFKHRFSADGQMCVLLSFSQLEMQVWDLVEQRLAQSLSFTIPRGFGRAIECLNFGQQMSMDGTQIVLGVSQQMTPWLMTNGEVTGKRDFKFSEGCAADDYGKTNVLGNVSAISENGKYAAACANLEGSVFCVWMQPVNVAGAQLDQFCKVLEFKAEGESGGRLLLSGNNRCIAWVSKEKIRVWSTISEHWCMPTYGMLKETGLSHDEVAIKRLLDMHGECLLKYPDKEGWMLLARAIEDHNTGMVTWILDWAEDRKQTTFLELDVHRGRVEGSCRNLLQLARKRQNLDCLRLLLDRVLSGSIPCNVGAILGESLFDLIDTHPALFEDVLCSSHILQEQSEVLVPFHTIQGKPFLVCTSDELFPDNLEALWSGPGHVFVESKVRSLIQKSSFLRQKTRSRRGRLKVPALSYVIPVEGMAKIGAEGLLGQVFAKDIGSRVFASLPLKCIITLKWDSYGKALLTQDMVSFCFLLVMFTVYSLVLGHSCKGSDDLGKVEEVFCGFFLAMAIVPSGFGLFRELKQLVTYLREGKGLAYYWFKSKWNALEFASYLLIAIVTPALHFGGNPCDAESGVSWVAPIVCILLWWKTLYFAQVARSTGPLVLMIFAIMKDIAFFLLIGFGVMFGFGVAFTVLYRGSADHEDEFGSIIKALMSVFAMMLADFDLGALYSSPTPAMAVLLFLVYMFIMAIVLLNLLIAIMGDSFDRIKGTEEEQFSKARASVIEDMEAMLPNKEKGKIRERIGRYVHVLLPKDRVEAKKDWHGRMVEIEERFRGVVAQSNGHQQKSLERMEAALKTFVEQRVKDINRARTEQDRAMHQRIDVLESNIKQWVDRIRKAGQERADRISSF